MLAALGAFAVAMLAVGVWSSSRVDDAEDYVVAGRRLGLGLAFPTLLATWFGAGTLLVAADEVATDGLRAAALDPIGCGVCLLIAGLFLARPLWRMKLATLPDLFRLRFGPRAELWAGILMVPGYVGWTAAQYTALGGLVAHLTGLDPMGCLVGVAAVGIVYTLLGGMWAVAVTDALQMAVIVAGLLGVGWLVMAGLGAGDPLAGATRVWASTPPDARAFVPGDALGPWVAAFAAGALGNLPGQDLTQRMFAARSEGVAMAACLLAGAAYLTLGLIPLLLALSARVLLPEIPGEAVLTAVVEAGHSPWLATLFALTVAAAVLSTIDSAILAPASVLARNVVSRVVPESLAVHRAMVAVVGLCALGLAFLGEDAYSLLEASYEVSMVSLLVPLVGGVYAPRGSLACLGAMAVGTSLWVAHLALGLEGLFTTPVPVGLGCTSLAGVAYAVLPARTV